jgi:predicted AlkP superfamily phosphohydrolase/phosphomutase
MVDKMHCKITQKTVLIGLDGATFNIIDPYIRKGYLPNLERIKKNGAWGQLTSTNPPTTPPAWTSCITGLNPGRHGIYDFTQSPLKHPDRPLVTSSSVHGLKMWHIANRFNKKAVIVNVPMTYPPEPIESVMISGMMTPGYDSPFTYPENVKIRLKAVCGNYIPDIDIPRYDVERDSDAERFLDDLGESFTRRHEAVRHLMTNDSWDVFMIVYILMDRIQHLFYKYLVPGDPLYETSRGSKIRQRVIEEYQRLDHAVGELMQMNDEQASCFLISDHGFGPTSAYFNANTWLMQSGYLKVHRLNYMKKRLFHFGITLNSDPIARKLVPVSWRASVRHLVRKQRSTFHSARNDLSGVIDWVNTRAYFASIPTQGIYIHEKIPGTSGIVEPGNEVTDLKNEIKDRLLTLHHPVTNNRLIDDVWFREEIFHGDQTKWAPHILFRMADYSILGRQHLGARHWFTSTSDQPFGFHRKEGIFMACGRSIQPGILDDISIMDVLPTVLFSSQIPVPDNLDGRVILNAFTDQFKERNPVQTFKVEPEVDDADCSDPYSSEEQKVIHDRLRSLGYLE